MTVVITGDVLRLFRSLAISDDSEDEHRVAVAVKAIARGDGLAIRGEDSIAAGECGDEHQQRGSRQMEVGNQTGYKAELMAGMNEEARLSMRGDDRLIIWSE